MAPGQNRFLFRFGIHDLNEYPKSSEQAAKLKNESFTIVMEWDSGGGLLNWFLSLPWRVRGKRRFGEQYTFFPAMVAGDFPAAEYAP